MPAWPNADEANVIGQRIQRIDGPDKVTGKAKFTYDINLPGMLYGKILRCPHPHARVVQIDTSKAEKLKGVKAVHTAKEAGQICFYAGDFSIFAKNIDDIKKILDAVSIGIIFLDRTKRSVFFANRYFPSISDFNVVFLMAFTVAVVVTNSCISPSFTS